MVDREQVRQQRDISGDMVLVCDRCGQAIDPALAHIVEPEPAELAQSGSETWLCPECWQALESGNEGLEPQVELNEPFEPE